MVQKLRTAASSAWGPASYLDGARIGTYSIVAAGSVVRERQEVPPGVLVAGVLARVVRELMEEERHRIEESAEHYVECARRYRAYFAGVAGGHVQQS